MALTSIFPDVSDSDLTNANNLIDQDNDTYASKALSNVPNIIFTNSTLLEDVDFSGAAYDTIYQSPFPDLPTSKTIVTFDNWETPFNANVPKFAGISLRLKVLNGNEDGGGFVIKWNKELFNALDDDLPFHSLKLVCYYDSVAEEMRYYNAYLDFGTEESEDNSFGAAVVPFIPQLLLQLQNKAKKKK